MKIASYIIRFLLSLLFGVHGIEKLFTQVNPEKFVEGGMDQPFIDFYLLLENTGYLKFVGLLQLLCTILLIFSRTYLIASVMLIPMILCLIATHIFLSHNIGYIFFDTLILALCIFLIYPSRKDLMELFLKQKGTWI